MAEVLLVFNAGSTSMKFAAYDIDASRALSMRCSGSIESMATAPHLVIGDPAGHVLSDHEWPEGHPLDQDEGLRFVVAWLMDHLSGDRIVAVGHRIMLGGARFCAPVLIAGDVLAYLDGLSAMEPSHQPLNVRGVRTLASLMPGVPQVACFDSSFHHTMPETACTYALPKDVRDAGIRHWGYHGLSYEYISGRMRTVAPGARRLIVAHLGGGSSMCAVLDGASVDTTMGFAGVSGLPMATRSGDVPAGALLYLLRSKLFDVASLEKMLYERSGLLGLSGISGDMRELQDSLEPNAIRAVQQFVYAMTKYVGAYTAVLGGLDALVFTGGIGEHSHRVRAALCRQLPSLGIELDEPANVSNNPLISSAESKVSVWVTPTDEELMIARHTLEVAVASPAVSPAP